MGAEGLFDIGLYVDLGLIGGGGRCPLGCRDFRCSDNGFCSPSGNGIAVLVFPHGCDFMWMCPKRGEQYNRPFFHFVFYVLMREFENTAFEIVV